jgi:predicted DsbA family dithiol-disulfide isomerase
VPAIRVEPGTAVLFADIGCPWAHHAVWRWHDTRRRLGLEERVTLDVRAFPLELFNARPTPKRTLEGEIPVVGALGPDAGWQIWSGPTYEWPVTTLPALEAVEAAKDQGLKASEQLDWALRKAFFASSLCISMRAVILEVAEGCDRIDAGKLADALDDGRARRSLMDQLEVAESSKVRGSPHFFLVDGSNWHNPGVKHHLAGVDDDFPIIDSFDPGVYDDMLKRAATGER